MDFEDSQDEAKFRAEVRSWLDQNAKGSTADGDEMADRSDKDFLARARAWQAKKAKAGYARITWPKEVGGFGGTPIQQVIFSQEESKSNVAGQRDKKPHSDASASDRRNQRLSKGKWVDVTFGAQGSVGVATALENLVEDIHACTNRETCPCTGDDH